jgi:hypothetical protein
MIIIREAYPTSFDMDYFKGIQSFSGRMDYCKRHLKRLGAGSSRIVYEIDNSKVLKLAKNTKGIYQNETETEWADDYVAKDAVAQVFDSHEQYHWIEMEKCEVATIKKFNLVTGVHFSWFLEVVYEILYPSYRNKSSKEKDAVYEKDIFSPLLDFIMSVRSVQTGDLKKVNSYGFVERGGKKMIVLIDYGLNEDIIQNFYR